MNFHIPCDGKGLNRYKKFLKGFNYFTIPSLHKRAWMALTSLESNYHATAGKTDELTLEFCRGLKIFCQMREI